MNKKEKIILAFVILTSFIICVTISKLLTKPDDTVDTNNIYNVKMDKQYSKSSNSFTITFSNLGEDVIVTDTDTEYQTRADKNGEVTYIDLEPGSTHKYIINYITEKKKNERTVTVTLPYYNEFYNSDTCKNYKKLEVCSKQFLNYQITEDLFNSTIENYNKTY